MAQNLKAEDWLGVAARPFKVVGKFMRDEMAKSRLEGPVNALVSALQEDEHGFDVFRIGLQRQNPNVIKLLQGTESWTDFAATMNDVAQACQLSDIGQMNEDVHGYMKRVIDRASMVTMLDKRSGRTNVPLCIENNRSHKPGRLMHYIFLANDAGDLGVCLTRRFHNEIENYNPHIF